MIKEKKHTTKHKLQFEENVVFLITITHLLESQQSFVKLINPVDNYDKHTSNQ